MSSRTLFRGPNACCPARALRLRFVPENSQSCSPDAEEIAEAYCLERLGSNERLVFEHHYLICPRCASIVAATGEYIRAMKGALSETASTDGDAIGRARTDAGRIRA